jgi:hypothetical protein
MFHQKAIERAGREGMGGKVEKMIGKLLDAYESGAVTRRQVITGLAPVAA